MELLLIVWSIIKVIGCIFLAILFFVFLILLLVLFSPIDYAMTGVYKKDATVKVDIKWILRAIHFYASYQNEKLEISFKLFGYCVYGSDKKQKKKKSTSAVEKEDVMISAREKQQLPEQSKKQQQQETSKKQQTQSQTTQHRRVKVSEIEQTQQQYQKETSPQQKKSKQKTKKQGQALNKEYFLHMEQKRECLKGIVAFSKRMLKGVLPKNFYLKATIGTGDPALTGYFMAMVGVLKMKFGKNLQIMGDFKEMTIKDIFFDIKGSIFLAYLLYAVIRLLCVKPIWNIIKLAWKGNR